MAELGTESPQLDPIPEPTTTPEPDTKPVNQSFLDKTITKQDVLRWLHLEKSPPTELTTKQDIEVPTDADDSTIDSFWDKKLSRRDVLKIGAVGAAVVATGGVIAATNEALKTPAPPHDNGGEPSDPVPTNIPDSSPNKLVSPETPSKSIEFGFNTHLHNEAENMTLELFKKCVEDLSNHGQQWIRLNLQGYNTSKPDIMSDFDQGLEFAKQKGLKVILVATDPPDPNDLTSVSDFYSGIAERFKGKVDVWQFFNEANVHGYQDYGERPTLTPDYLKGFSEAVKAASTAIKQMDSQAKTTVNLSAWVGDDWDVVAEGKKFFGSVKDSIDIATLDLYPDGNEEEISRYPEYIALLNDALGKDIMVGEIGWPTLENGFTPQDQAKYMEKVMSAFQGGRVKPIAVLFYEWADEEGVGESKFGANDKYGQPKDINAYQQLIKALQPPQQESSVTQSIA